MNRSEHADPSAVRQWLLVHLAIHWRRSQEGTQGGRPEFVADIEFDLDFSHSNDTRFGIDGALRS